MPTKDDFKNSDLVTFSVGSSKYLMAPIQGFRLMRWTIQTITDKREILHWPENTGDNPLAFVHGGNPLLFPFAGRSFDRGVENAWRSPGGDRLSMPIHGFARECQFLITDQSDNCIKAVLQPDESAKATYPFEYRLKVGYTFNELSFSVEMILENHGDEQIPWSAGHHFYFTLPWHTDASRSDYLIKMDPKKCAYHGPDGKLVMERDRETCHEISDASLNDRIHWNLRHNRVSFGPKGGEEDIHIIIGEENIPQKNHSLVTWSESESAPYYCIEPWMGPPNAAEHGKGLHWVAPGEEESFKVEVSLF